MEGRYVQPFINLRSRVTRRNYAKRGKLFAVDQHHRDRKTSQHVWWRAILKINLPVGEFSDAIYSRRPYMPWPT